MNGRATAMTCFMWWWVIERTGRQTPSTSLAGNVDGSAASPAQAATR